MNRRKILKTLLAFQAAAGGLATAGTPLFPGKRIMTLQRKVIRGEPRNSETAPAGSFARTESDGLLFLTNGFGFQYQIPPDSYIEWHLDKTNSQMKFKCVNLSLIHI